MINSDDQAQTAATLHDEEVDNIVAAGPVGALTVAGIATGIVVLLWLLFYWLVFMPRGGVQ